MCLQLFWKTMLLKCCKQTQDKTRAGGLTVLVFQQLWDIFNLIISESYFILFHPISSYFILFHPISSYFILFPRCFTMFHHLFRGTRLFEASLVERETEREGSLAAAGFCCQNSPSNPGRARHCIMSLPHFLKNDLNIFEHCVDNRIDIP